MVSGNAAAVPELMVGLFNAYLTGNIGESMRLEPLVEEVVRLGHGGTVCLLKELLRSRGFDLGTARIRSVSPRDTDGTPIPSDALRAAFSWDVAAAKPATASRG